MLEWVVPIEAPRDDPELVLQSLEVQGATLSAPDHPTVCEDDVGEVGADIAYAEAEQRDIAHLTSCAGRTST